MKSIFQEASSLGDAIEKAWEAVGSPEGFDVKVLKLGEKNFFGFCKVPYAVCVTASSNSKNAKNSDNQNSQGDNFFVSEKTGKNTSSARYSKDASAKNSSLRKNSRSSFPAKDSFTEEKPVDLSEVAVEADNWIKSDAILAEQYLSDILQIIGLSDFNIKSSSESNYLNLDIVHKGGAPFLEKSFFICIAPLIVQMVKKSSGKNPKGLRIVISHTEE